MRRIGAVSVAAVFLLTAASGCGTMLNLDGKEKFDFGGSDCPTLYVMKYQRPTFAFGGVANDIAWIKDASQPTDVFFSVADLPFSLAGDIVTFPWAAYQSLIVVRPQPNPTSRLTSPTGSAGIEATPK